MASTLGVSYPAWQRYELGKNVPGSSVIEALTKIGVNGHWILTGEGDMMIAGKETATLSQEAVDAVRNVESQFNKFCGPENLKHVSIIFSAINQYTRHSGQDFTNERSGSLAAILIALTETRNDEWKTEENYLHIINIIEKLNDYSQPLKELGISSQAAILLARYLQNPDYIDKPIRDRKLR